MSRALNRAERLREMERLYIERAYSDAEMAERLRVDRTTAYRDRLDLTLEYPVEEVEPGRYRMNRTKYLSLIKVNLHEALALYLAARRASRQTRFAQPHMASALEKLAVVLRQPMTEKLSRAAEQVLKQESNPERIQVIETVTRAWAEQRRLRLVYRGLKASRAAEHLFEPYLVEPAIWSEGAYVIGYSHVFQDLATLRLERIEQAELTAQQYEIPGDFDEHELLKHAWGIWVGEEPPQTVALRFEAGPAARRLRESIWHPTQKIEELEGGGCIWTAQVAEWQEMLPWVRGWGASVEVLEPEGLRQEMKREAKRLFFLYEIDLPVHRKIYYAHSKVNEDEKNWQLLIDHLKKTGELARKFGAQVKADDLAYIVGLVHDLGKYSSEFQERLRGKKIRVDHSTAGAQELIKILDQSPQQKYLATLLAYPITGHHSGLLDYGDPSDLPGDSTLVARLKTNLCDYSAYKIDLELTRLPFPNSINIRPLKLPGKSQRVVAGFSLAFYARMIFSALVDADFQETERYMRGDQPRGQYDDISVLCERMNQFLLGFDHPQTEINRKRNETLKACVKMSSSKPGFFTLTIPTGGGKTLASLAFALNHAVKNNLKRIIYIIPFTSIIEQNAAIFKHILGTDKVLEHHSNFDLEILRRDIGGIADNQTNSVWSKLKLAAENWDIPIIVTTNVQFFESLYSNKSSRSRKIHHLAQSVMIFDEAQMLPREYMIPAMAATWELVTNYGSSSVFCTATQPGLERFLPGEVQWIELASDPPGLFNFYRRVEVKNLDTLSDEELLKRLNAHKKVLCIVNTRRHASGLFRGLAGDGNFHLSTLMCPVHRKEILGEIQQRLQPGCNDSCRVVSTSVMEAGIDLDFPVGYRALSGLDSINQAAGRVNRNMKLEQATIYVFEPESEFEKRLPRYVQQAAEITRRVLREYAQSPISIPAIQSYFDQLYSFQDPQLFDYKKILDCFDDNQGRFQFETAAKLFKIIEDETIPIIIPYNEEVYDLVEQLKYSEYPSAILRRLQPYTVSIYKSEFENLQEKGAILTIAEAYSYVNPDCYRDYYSPETGLMIPASHGGLSLFY
jgi:CRISPR-associated endonuclease/helicase Cas3